MRYPHREYDDRLNGRNDVTERFSFPEASREDVEDPALEASWRSLSDFLRSQCGGTKAFVLSGSKDAVNYLRMRPAMKAHLSVGGVEAKLYEFRVLPPKNADGSSNVDINSV